MSEHSEYGGFVSSQLITAPGDYEPLDTSQVVTLTNNLKHAYDSATQQRANAIYKAPVNKGTSTDWKMLAKFTWIPFIRADGSPAPLAVSIEGYNSGAGTFRARAVYSPHLRTSGAGTFIRLPMTTAPNWAQKSPSAASLTRYDFDLLYMTAAEARSAWHLVDVLRAVGEGRMAINVPFVRLDLWVQGPGHTNWGVGSVDVREFID